MFGKKKTQIEKQNVIMKDSTAIISEEAIVKTKRNLKISNNMGK